MNNTITPLSLSIVCVSGVLLSACGSVEKNDTDLTQLTSDKQIKTNQQQNIKETEKTQLTNTPEIITRGLTSAAVKASAKHKNYIMSERSATAFKQRPQPSVIYNQDSFMHAAEENRENYNHFTDNVINKSIESPLSTFSIDVDTGAYSNVRRFINQGQLPQRDAVRAEELINYFSYNYEYPQSKSQPFTINTEIAPSPWNKNSHLLHIGLQAYQSFNEQRPANNLVFLVDVSGSMQSKDKLQLLKSGLKLLVKNLDENDRISIVTYAGSSGVVLKPTKGDQTAEISMALDNLTAAGSTNGASGIKLAYQMAQQSFIKEGVNRIVLATDGDFNVGVTDFEALKQIVEEKRKTGVSLTTLGFGQGNYNDHLMEQLADVGNGNYSYIDNLNEARKVLVEEMSSTLNTVANDVKIQVEFNPHQVSEYRLIGYENRALKREDFKNDKVDAGDIGESHTVTALYEVTFTDSPVQQLGSQRYTRSSEAVVNNYNNELAFLRLRYKKNSKSSSQLIEKPLYKSEIITNMQQASNNFKFSASVAAFAQQLRGGKYLQNFSYNDILELARKSKGDDVYGYRGEFIQLVTLAQSLDS
ncbi:MAG: VWA domain-containing protein [Gammaproteobacteria bacterium]|nr:VWA domain-containing protein [Gammaproteobacteria bacterium]